MLASVAKGLEGQLHVGPSHGQQKAFNR